MQQASTCCSWDHPSRHGFHQQAQFSTRQHRLSRHRCSRVQMQAQSKTISVDKLKSELLDGSLLSNVRDSQGSDSALCIHQGTVSESDLECLCKEAFPKVPWGPPELVK
eukprot:scaffold200136_cov22-Tisochrysis_lutea.AAC.1